jgi:hypothetical protein
MTEQHAIELYESGWWMGKTAREICMFQLFEPRLCMPFGKFHEAVTEALGRPVYTHEFGLNVEGLQAELLGDKEAPTFEEIIQMIPEAKRIILQV